MCLGGGEQGECKVEIIKCKKMTAISVLTSSSLVAKLP